MITQKKTERERKGSSSNILPSVGSVLARDSRGRRARKMKAREGEREEG